jgi:hypothetical protein
MARFVINDLVYDTNKMEHLGKVGKWYKFTGVVMRSLYGENAGRTYDCDLYCSAKKRYLIVHEDDCFRIVGEAITEDEVKELAKRNNYTLYSMLFGELEEA